MDALIVERLKAAGAVTVGKTNTPEFGAGSQTFNTVFGATIGSITAGAASGAYSLDVTYVPAPGAVALMGLAGLVAGRRRR
jgi:amidase